MLANYNIVSLFVLEMKEEKRSFWSGTLTTLLLLFVVLSSSVSFLLINNNINNDNDVFDWKKDIVSMIALVTHDFNIDGMTSSEENILLILRFGMLTFFIIVYCNSINIW